MICSTKVTLTELVQKEFLEGRSALNPSLAFLERYRLACLLRQGLDRAAK
jgi:hypothetical protein